MANSEVLSESEDNVAIEEEDKDNGDELSDMECSVI